MTKLKNILFTGINHEHMVSGQNLEILKRLVSAPMDVSESTSTTPDLIICVDVNDADLRQVRKWHKRGVPTVLIASEPRVVVPANYSKKTLATFDRIVEVGRPKTDPLLPWPQHSFANPALGPKPNSGNAILIQSRKYSFVKGQLYGLRAQLAAEDNRVYVVGHSWDEKVFRTIGRLCIEFLRAVRSGVALDFSTFVTGFQEPINLLGPSESKIVAMSQFRVAVVIENSQEYMSEKFFDALVGGCIPVYVGPDLSDFEIPTDVYLKAGASLASVKEGITTALGLDYDLWQSRVKEFLAAEKTIRMWESSNALSRILKSAILDDTQSNH
jgi:hypothetical protein